jgi:hypothetical protein
MSSKLEQEFLDFHGKNPCVYELFDNFTRLLLDRGYEHHSADAVLHRIRWATTVETTEADFKINNNYSAYYARLWMKNNPAHEGFFRCRELRGQFDDDDCVF